MNIEERIDKLERLVNAVAGELHDKGIVHCCSNPNCRMPLVSISDRSLWNQHQGMCCECWDGMKETYEANQQEAKHGLTGE